MNDARREWETACGMKPHFSRDDLETLLTRRPLAPDEHHTPTRFVSSEPFRLVPHVRGHPLPRYREHLRLHRITRTMSCLPHFLQLDPMVFWTHRDARIPHAAVSHSQVQAIQTMVRELQPECVVATSHTARAIETALAAGNSTAAFHWYLISDVRAPEAPLRDRPSYLDYQFFPGKSCGYQCAELSSAREGHFHLAPEYTWGFEDGYAVATDGSQSPLRLYRYQAFRSSERGTCGCGEKRYAAH